MASIDLYNDKTKEIETDFVCRNFNIEDRVNTYFNGKFYSGKVVKKWFDRNGWFEKEPWLLIKTDEKVDNESDALLNGYGIQGPADGKNLTCFEDEPLPYGDEIYKKRIKRPATLEEMNEHNIQLPF